jgi:hypothetical protein
MVGTESTLEQRIVWTLRSIARRERRLDVDARKLTEPGLLKWAAFAGRLHEGDFVSLLIENNAALSPVALQPLKVALTATDGKAFLEEGLRAQSNLLTASTANFLEAAAVAFGRSPLSAARRSAFEPIRAQEQRILEMPSTAARVAAMVAEPLAPLETYVSYVVADNDDDFLVGLAMLEFDRTAMPSLIRISDLQNGTARLLTTFSRAATLGGEEEILALFPEGTIQRVISL